MSHHLDMRMIRESLPALLIALSADTVAGFLMDHFYKIFILIPGLLMVLPALIDMRGNVYGAFIARLSSKLHLGEIKDIHDRKVKICIYSTKALAYSASLLIGIIVGFLSFWHTCRWIYILLIPSIILVNHLFTTNILTPITAYIGVKTYKSGWNPDNVGVPLLSSVGDLVTVAFLIAVGYLFLPILRIPILIGIIAGIILVYVFYLLRIVFNDKEGRKIYRESIIILLIVAFIELATGGLWEANKIGIILLLLPPTLETLGNIGSIFSSRLSSFIYLGFIEPNFLPSGKYFRREIFSIVFLMVTLYGILTPVILCITFSIKAIILLWIAVPASAFMLILISYYLTIGSLKLKLDPDNVVIPVITTLADIIGSASIIFLYTLIF